jgi:hypothetical protein
MPLAGGYLTKKNTQERMAVLTRCPAVFFFFHFLLLFVSFFIICDFSNLLFTIERGKVCYFLLFFTTCNFHKLLFIVEKGQGLYSIHCAMGENVHLDFFPYFFTVEGEGGGG